jgi:hypothetical protein
MDAAKVDLIVQYALAVAAREDDDFDRELGPIHLLKFVYLADLAHAEKRGDTYTGAPWIFHHYGPWSVAVHNRIESAATAIGALKEVRPSKFDSDFVRWSLPEHEDDAERLFDKLDRQLPSEVAAAVKRGVRQFGKNTPGLLNYVYTTKPMLRAAPSEQLVFEREEDASAETSPAPAATLSKRKRKELLEKIREHVQAHLQEEMQRRKSAFKTQERYDATFAEGQEYLDRLAGEDTEQGSFEAEFSDDIWKSPARGEPGVP